MKTDKSLGTAMFEFSEHRGHRVRRPNEEEKKFLPKTWLHRKGCLFSGKNLFLDLKGKIIHKKELKTKTLIYRFNAF